MDQYTERTTMGLGSRLLQSIKGMVVGLLFFVAAFPVLWINEGYALRTARSLSQGAKEVVSVTPGKIDPANEGKLVHLTGRTATTETVTDPDFSISANTAILRRKVEMYQWKETSSSRTRTNTGGSETTTTTYKYEHVWSEQPIDSSSFKRPDGHQNPAMPLRSADFVANHVTVGPYRLNETQTRRLSGADPVDVSGAQLPDSIRSRAHKVESGFQTGESGSPRVGDLRVIFSQVKPAEVSLVARQVGETFEPYRAKAGGAIDLIATGVQSAGAMFDTAETHNTIRTWVLRGVGLLLMFMGLALLLKPLSTLGDVVPIVGGMMRAGLGLLSFGLALCVSMLMIATAWIAYRPLVGIGLLAGAALLMFIVTRRRKSAPEANSARAAGA